MYKETLKVNEVPQFTDIANVGQYVAHSFVAHKYEEGNNKLLLLMRHNETPETFSGYLFDEFSITTYTSDVNKNNALESISTDCKYNSTGIEIGEAYILATNKNAYPLTVAYVRALGAKLGTTYLYDAKNHFKESLFATESFPSKFSKNAVLAYKAIIKDIDNQIAYYTQAQR